MPSAVEPAQKVVVLLSGGVDSTTVAALAVAQFGPEYVYPIGFYYGQKHECELTAAIQIAEKLDTPPYRRIAIPNIFRGAPGSRSTLTNDDVPNPETTYKEIAETQGVSPTYVPFRNGTMLSLAAAYALTLGAVAIYYGAHAEDARNWAYPDCTPEFNGSMASAIFVGTYFKVRLCTPLQWLMKTDVVEMAHRLGAPLDLTYSCYNGRVRHCGKCPTCVERIHAFQEAGYIDPVSYEIDIEWKGPILPWKLSMPTKGVYL